MSLVKRKFLFGSLKVIHPLSLKRAGVYCGLEQCEISGRQQCVIWIRAATLCKILSHFWYAHSPCHTFEPIHQLKEESNQTCHIRHIFYFRHCSFHSGSNKIPHTATLTGNPWERAIFTVPESSIWYRHIRVLKQYIKTNELCCASFMFLGNLVATVDFLTRVATTGIFLLSASTADRIRSCGLRLRDLSLGRV